jgi:hypothetical protein
VRSVAAIPLVRSATTWTFGFCAITFFAAVQPLTPVAFSTHSSPIFFALRSLTAYSASALAMSVSTGRIRNMFGAPLGPFATSCSPDDNVKNGTPASSIRCDKATTCELAGNPTITSGFWSSACNRAVCAASGVNGAGIRVKLTLLPSCSAAIDMPSA